MNKTYNYNQLMQLPSRYRGKLLNKISGLKPANLIGTCSANGAANLAVFNSVVHIGANPPYLGFVLRPTTVERHTYENIKAVGRYTINQITTAIHEQAHQTSAKYEKDVSEFEAVALTPLYHEDFPSPFVAESPIKIGLEFQEEHYIHCNGTRLVIGKVVHLELPEVVIAEDGDVALEQLDSVAIGGLDSYYSVSLLAKYKYAEVKQ